MSDRIFPVLRLQALLRQAFDNNVCCYCDGSNYIVFFPFNMTTKTDIHKPAASADIKKLSFSHIFCKVLFVLIFKMLTIQKQTSHVLLSISHYHYNHK